MHYSIVNLSSVTLSAVQRAVLSKGTNFRVPLKIKKEGTLTEFELLSSVSNNQYNINYIEGGSRFTVEQNSNAAQQMQYI